MVKPKVMCEMSVVTQRQLVVTLSCKVIFLLAYQKNSEKIISCPWSPPNTLDEGDMFECKTKINYAT